VHLRVIIATDVIDEGHERHLLLNKAGDVGAIAAFHGLCRSENGRLAALELEHYPGMAEAEIERICHQAGKRWPLHAITVLHRHGLVKPGETIVLVLAASSHRAAAFAGAEFVMDFLKTSAPFWKKEHRADGVATDWVDAKEADDAATARWG
jgi:molybdopterin synthase catalytic subunit